MNGQFKSRKSILAGPLEPNVQHVQAIRQNTWPTPTFKIIVCLLACHSRQMEQTILDRPRVYQQNVILVLRCLQWSGVSKSKLKGSCCRGVTLQGSVPSACRACVPSQCTNLCSVGILYPAEYAIHQVKIIPNGITRLEKVNCSKSPGTPNHL